MLGFNKYQGKAIETAQYLKVGSNLVYPALGLTGEAGEAADKIKKLWRNSGVDLLSEKDLTAEEIHELVKELGDVLWYVAMIAAELGIGLERVAQINVDKLADRAKRGVTKGSGDNR